MRSRYLAIAAAVWAVGYAAVYVALVSSQGNSPAWWYLTLLAAGSGSLAVAAVRRDLTLALIFGAACLAVAAMAGILSIGVLLVPAVIAAGVAAAETSRRRHNSGPASVTRQLLRRSAGRRREVL